MKEVDIIDSHTGGEPTRIVVRGGPELSGRSVAERLQCFREYHDGFRSAMVNEPRGSDVLVGALLCEPTDSSSLTGVIFFNNVGYLGMCGHGTIGLMVTLAYKKGLNPGQYTIETPVGNVAARLNPDGSVTVANVESYRQARAITVNVPGFGKVTGDVAWGGNWFFLVTQPEEKLGLAHVERLTDFAWRIRQAVNNQGFPEVDHVELFGPGTRPGIDSQNFVLCPGKAYDRSPCGTGTSAKLACLAADGKLAEGKPWVQESIVGSIFTGSYAWVDQAAGRVLPRISGSAYLTAEATLFLDPQDPFVWGIASACP